MKRVEKIRQFVVVLKTILQKIHTELTLISNIFFNLSLNNDWNRRSRIGSEESKRWQRRNKMAYQFYRMEATIFDRESSKGLNPLSPS